MDITVLLKDLVKNYNSYKGKTFVIADCPYYITSSNIHTYTMTIGKGGGCSLLLDTGITAHISSYDVKQANVKEGIYSDTSSYYDKKLVLPINDNISSQIQNLLQSEMTKLNNYKQLYDSRQKTVEHILEILSEHPEYLI